MQKPGEQGGGDHSLGNIIRINLRFWQPNAREVLGAETGIIRQDYTTISGWGWEWPKDTAAVSELSNIFTSGISKIYLDHA